MRPIWPTKNYTSLKKYRKLRFLLDMGIAQSVALWLRSMGHDATHLNDEDLYKLPDKLIIEKAIIENRIILTLDMDFGQLMALDKSKQTSIIQFRTSEFTSVNIKNKLDLFFAQFNDQLDDAFIITIEDNRIRYRKLPL
jgi:predicted nuclease of predicted toxin-antitoxin system